MRRVLVPLDGTQLSTSILPDARRLAGAEGELILIADATIPQYLGSNRYGEQRMAFDAAVEFLEAEAEDLQADGVSVRVQPFVVGNAMRAVDEAMRIFTPDMIACATHGRTAFQRLWWGSVAWSVLTHSHVPVLLRHAEDTPPYARITSVSGRRIMVPLDGSELAEKALPLAQQLASEWHASIYLARVVYDVTVSLPGYPGTATLPPEVVEKDLLEASEDLETKAGRLSGDAHVRILTGEVAPTLAQEVSELNITDIVMASHGRTGLPRVIAGSIAGDLIQRLHIPMIILPALATAKAPERVESREPVRRSTLAPV